jgi:hypothetical protein
VTFPTISGVIDSRMPGVSGMDFVESVKLVAAFKGARAVFKAAWLALG